MAEKKVSMQDIADIAGVARSTVSFVLNNKDQEQNISEQTVLRVREVASRLNYRVNNVARGLRTGQTYMIALVVADISDAFFGTLAYHLQKYAMEYGYILTIFNTAENTTTLKSIVEALNVFCPDGTIMVPVANMKWDTMASMNITGPALIIDRYFKENNVSRVCIDNYSASKEAVEYLVRQGCTRVAMITYKDSLCHMRDRQKGYEAALKEARIYDKGLICEVDYSKQEDVISTFLRKSLSGEEKIDGLFISTGGLGISAVKSLAHIETFVQSNLKIVCFDKSLYIGPNMFVPYVRQPIESMCRSAIDILVNQISSKSEEIVDCKLRATFIEQQ